MNVTYDMLIEGFKNIGLNKGDSVMAHSSLKAFGYVEGGADTIIDALIEVIGEQGTIIMPTFTLSFMNAQAPVFDVKNSPSEVGKITEIFRTRNNVYRSKHITHSVAIWGKDAKYIASLPSGTAWGDDSPFKWLLDKDGYILMLGTDYKTCTLIHKAEEDLQVPYRYMKTYPSSKIILEDGTIIDNTTKGYFLKQGVSSDWSELIKQLEAANITRQVQIGQATVKLAKARDIYNETLKFLKKDIFGLIKKTSDNE